MTSEIEDDTGVRVTAPETNPEPEVDVPLTDKSTAKLNPGKESLLFKLHKAREDSGIKEDYVQSCVASFCSGTCALVCGLVTLGITIGIPIAQLVLGILHLKHCPVEKHIPIFNLVAGVFGIVAILAGSIQKCIQKRSEGSGGECLGCCGSLIAVFQFCWFIAGSVWVYTAFCAVTYEVANPTYCHKGLYLFTFWVLTVVYIIIGIVGVLVLSGVSIACCLCERICGIVKKALDDIEKQDEKDREAEGFKEGQTGEQACGPSDRSEA